MYIVEISQFLGEDYPNKNDENKDDIFLELWIYEFHNNMNKMVYHRITTDNKEPETKIQQILNSVDVIILGSLGHYNLFFSDSLLPQIETYIKTDTKNSRIKYDQSLSDELRFFSKPVLEINEPFITGPNKKVFHNTQLS